MSKKYFIEGEFSPQQTMNLINSFKEQGIEASEVPGAIAVDILTGQLSLAQQVCGTHSVLLVENKSQA